MGKKRSTLFRFDVALSFARQDRPRAECVARAMQSLGLRVFYDKDHHADLWGKNRTAFDQIYGPDSAYFVPLISKHYSQREWTQYEFETAKREARIRSKEFILPLRVDNARQFGLTDDHNFLSLKEFTPEEVAAALRKKLNSDYMTRKPHSKRAANARILTLQSREALGLIVTAPIPMSFAHLRDFFPAIDWEKHLREFRADNLISADSTLFTPTKGVGKFFEEEFTSLQSKWAARLEELSGHVDCAYFLSLHYLKKRSLDDAVLTLANVAESMEPGYWVGLYVAAFDAMDNAKFLRKLKPEIRLAFHQAYGHCLAAIGRLEEARSQYGKLQHIGRKLGDTESLGLVLMNVGVTYHKSGDVASAKTWYERARSFGVDHKQPMLIANTIHNLGQLEVESDPQNAVRMLEESIQYKRENDDDYGIAASLQVIATAYAEMEDFQESLAYSRPARTLGQFGKMGNCAAAAL